MLEREPVVYLVMMDRGGLFGIYDNYHQATGAAQAIKGVVCELPILEDYRDA